MAERTVKHAFVSYITKDSNVVTIPRGHTHDFPDDVIKRHEEFGAFLEPDEEIQTIGEPRPISGDSTDEDVAAWLAGVSAVEMFQFLADHEEDEALNEKLQKAVEQVVDARNTPPADEDIPEGLAVTADGLTTRSPATEVDATGTSGPENFNTGHPDDSPHPEDWVDPTAEAEANAGMDGSLDHTLEPSDVVLRSVDFVSGFVSRNPELAEEILEAEKALAEEKGRDPRVGVVRAVGVAAGHTD